MNVVFMGTPAFAVAALRALAGDKNGRFSVKLALTRPNAASGRGGALLPSPVRLCAEEHGIPVLTPQSFFTSSGSLDTELLLRIAAAEPDFIIVAAYGMILPRQLLVLPHHGCINIHASLLPRWRGAAPIQRAILAGDEQTGISVMRMEEGLDTGDVCRVATVPAAGKSAQELTDELAELGARLLLEALPSIADGTAQWQAQDEKEVMYADKVGKHELTPSPADTTSVNLRKILASTPQSPARCVIAGRSVTILAAQPAAVALAPGLAHFSNRRLILTTVDGAFEVVALKPDGKKEMPASAFAAGVKELHKSAQTPATWRSLNRGPA
ncbi:MAG: methionyl-tRNA formyltransferase [Coriobacteriales bacterium]|jgi:methionyl-tRNA formyltransferase|nr:methionyl-tRNA formyltransferase [Coriobacteriales bacterium]